MTRHSRAADSSRGYSAAKRRADQLVACPTGAERSTVHSTMTLARSMVANPSPEQPTALELFTAGAFFVWNDSAELLAQYNETFERRSSRVSLGQLLLGRKP